MTQLFNMNGILRAKYEGGCMIERVKDGAAVGQAYSYDLAKARITQKAIDALKDLELNAEIQYTMSDYIIQDVWKKGSRNNGGGGRPFGSQAKTPEERRSIERQKAADIVSRVYVACIDKSLEPVPKTFKEMMATIREETVLLADVLGEPVKGGQ